ncbi:hypothetical protein [Pantoea vagans]|uniref:hypothetical protein n=1 Tax=Pantoea vagans TaxID=470934 RepID=UPI003B023A2F
MSGKINIACIIEAHFKSLKGVQDNKISKMDVLTFIIFPVGVALLCAYFSFNLNKDLDSLLVNFGAIFTALLLSVIVLIYDQENRILEKIASHPNHIGAPTYAKLKLLKELYHNISYAILCSLMLVVTTFIHSILPQNPSFTSIGIPGIAATLKLSWATTLVTPLIVVVTINIILTIIMIVKRLYLILINNNPGH